MAVRSNILTTPVQVWTTTTTFSNCVHLKADPNNTASIAYAITSNATTSSVTIDSAITTTTNDATIGFLLAAGDEVYIHPREFVQVGINPAQGGGYDARNVWVIAATTGGQRVYGRAE